MNECLVTTLKGTVDDDSLIGIGEFKMVLSQNGKLTFSVAPYKTVTVRLTGNGYLSSTDGGNEGKSITYTAGSTLIAVNLWIYVTSGSCNVFVKDNYTNIISINGVTDIPFDISILKYRSHMEQLIATRTSYGTIDGDVLLNNMTWEFNINTSNAKVDVRIFRNNSVLKSIRIYTTPSYGDIANFSNAVNLTRLAATDSEISGDLETLLEAWAGNKISECSVSIYKTKVKFNNALATSDNWTASFSGNTVTVKDRNNNTLGTYDGTNWDYPQQ